MDKVLLYNPAAHHCLPRAGINVMVWAWPQNSQFVRDQKLKRLNTGTDNTG